MAGSSASSSDPVDLVQIPPHMVWTRGQIAEEEPRFQVWKAQYLYPLAGFEDERMEAGVFRLGE